MGDFALVSEGVFPVLPLRLLSIDGGVAIFSTNAFGEGIVALILCKLSKASRLRFLLFSVITVGCKSFFSFMSEGDDSFFFDTFFVAYKTILRKAPIDSSVD